MADSSASGNRKQRRQAARNQKSLPEENVLPKMEMRHPDRSGSKGKTLLDIAAERNLLNGKPAAEDIVETDISALDGSATDADPIGPLGNAIFLAITLSMLHFTLDVLVYHQYAQSIEWNEILKRTAMVGPQLILVAWMLHSKTVSHYPLAKQILLLLVSIATGGYLIVTTNKYDYFAVMKRAPPTGTLLVWSVMEMDLQFSLASVFAILGYLWWSGYSIL